MVFCVVDIFAAANSTDIEVGSAEHREIWMTRLREVQGSLMVAALFEVFLGVTGAVGGLLRFIGECIWPMCNNSLIWCIFLLRLHVFPSSGYAN